MNVFIDFIIVSSSNGVLRFQFDLIFYVANKITYNPALQKLSFAFIISSFQLMFSAKLMLNRICCVVLPGFIKILP